MHGTIYEWLDEVRLAKPEFFQSGLRVLEYGSRNINGGVRRYFPASGEYVGIDAHPGPGVDVVGVVHEYEHPTGEFDVVISTETLEHDPYWKRTLLHAHQNLRSGGVLLMTCAAPAREPHNHNDSPLPGYYANLSVDDVRDHLLSLGEWTELDVHLRRRGKDLHCLAIKP